MNQEQHQPTPMQYYSAPQPVVYGQIPSQQYQNAPHQPAYVYVIPQQAYGVPPQPVASSECSRSRFCFLKKVKSMMHMKGDRVYKALIILLVLYVALSIFQGMSGYLLLLSLLNIAVAIYGGLAIKKQKTTRIAVFNGILLFKLFTDIMIIGMAAFLLAKMSFGDHRHSDDKTSRSALHKDHDSDSHHGHFHGGWSLHLVPLVMLLQVVINILGFIHLKREYKRQEEQAQQEAPSDCETENGESESLVMQQNDTTAQDQQPVQQSQAYQYVPAASATTQAVYPTMSSQVV